MDPDHIISPQTGKTSENRNYNPVVITMIVIVVVLAFGLGFLLSQSKYPKPSVSNTNNAPKSDPIFSQQNAVIVGRVSKIGENDLTLTDQSNHTEDFPLGRGFIIHRLSTDDPKLSNLDPNSIDTKRSMTATLDMQDGVYKIVEVDYISNFGIASSSALLK